MPIMYYGSKISDNILKTPEGYLICKNVPIGRLGHMEYYGEELGISEKSGELIKVVRKPEELFSKATIASFEGKPVTNNHPTQNLDINTIHKLSRGHAQNVRAEGDYLIGDLYIVDAGLISEIENGKREVSCGYDCMWEPLDEEGNEYEQKEIVGNHIAVVTQGRAGPKVAIKDSKPIEGSKTMSKQANKKLTIAKIFKFMAAKDASPEEIVEAMDVFEGEGGVGEGETAGEQKKEDNSIEQVLAAIKEVGVTVQGLAARVSALEESDKKVHAEVEGADAEFAGLEKEMAQDEKAEEGGGEAETVEAESKDEAAEGEGKEEEKKESAAMDAFYQGMKKTIMAIPDKQTRDAMAKQFCTVVRDSKTSSNSYGSILKNAQDSKMNAQKQSQTKQASLADTAALAAEYWNNAGKKYNQ